MSFPSAKRVIYKKNPLDKVICQLRFPPILSIEADVPAKFQEAIRNHFPNYKEKKEVQLNKPFEIEGNIPVNFLPDMQKSSMSTNHEFSDEEEIWVINLTKNFLAISTKSYSRWEIFRENFKLPFEALMNIYKPSYITRTGLRYIDVIRRSELNLIDRSWNELINPYFLGLLASNIEANVINFENNFEIKLEGDSNSVKITSTFVEPIASKIKEKCFYIDSDFFSIEKVSIENVFDRLDFFHVNASNLIQWVITKELHEAMEPEAI